MEDSLHQLVDRTGVHPPYPRLKRCEDAQVVDVQVRTITVPLHQGARMPVGTLVLLGGMANAISTVMAARRPTDSSAPRLRFEGVFIVVVGGSGR